MGGDALPGAGEAEPFLGRRLDAAPPEIYTAGRRQTLPHLLDIGSELGGLGQNRRIQIGNGIAGLPDAVRDLREQPEAVCAPILRVRIREESTDVPERRRAEKSVSGRVRQNVGVRMAEEPWISRRPFARRCTS